MEILRDIPVYTNTSDVLMSLGYEKSKVPARIRSRVKRLFADVKHLSMTGAAYQRTHLKVGGGRIVLGGRSRVKSALLKRVLESCYQVVVFVVTLGPDVDRLIDRMQSTSIQDAFLVDAMASRMAEDAADSFQKEVGKRLRREEGMTLRYSPGYCDWPLSQQGVVFSNVDGQRIGVSLNDHFVMSPKKSVSGIIGVGRKDLVEKSKNACDFCRRAGCKYRRST